MKYLVDRPIEDLPSVLKMDIRKLGMSTRLVNALTAEVIRQWPSYKPPILLADVFDAYGPLTENRLWILPEVGRKTMEEFGEVMNDLGLELDDSGWIELE
jgi:DNA-directed RNA polymerase alpha subunit